MKHRFSILVALLAFLVWIQLLVMNQGFPILGATVLLLSGFYLLGLVRLWRSAGFGHGVPAWRAGSFFAGMAVLLFALSNPIDALADRAFSMHMVQHMLLVKVIAPLLLLGELSSVFLWAVGSQTARKLGGAWRRLHWARASWKQLTNPCIAWTLFTLGLWIWHIPTFYQAALRSEPLHGIEHLMFLGTSLLFWWFLLQKGHDRRTRYGMVVLYLFTTLMQESVLGALLTFSSGSWYSLYISPDLWGLSPLADQQLAGVLMWLPGGILFMLLIVLYFGWWLQTIERSQPTHPPSLVHTGDPND